MGGEKHFEALFESAPDAMVIVDGAGLIVVVNAQAERFFGYDRAELIGKTVEILVPSKFRPNHAHYRQDFFADPKVRGMRALTKSGVSWSRFKKSATVFDQQLKPYRSRQNVFVLSQEIVYLNT